MHFNRLINGSGVLVLLILSGRPLFSQTEAKPAIVRIMFYNVENLFDIYDDPATDDNEFLPAGARRWNLSRYRKKINSIYKVITAAGEWDPPALIGLCEIENRNVLEDLVYDTYLSNFNYGIVHEDSPDERGIDVGLIYRKDIVNVLHFRSLVPSMANGQEFRSRSILYTKCRLSGDTLHLLINHWPSRRGGVLAGESDRIKLAGLIKAVADSLNEHSTGNSKIIVMGDFNCTPDDPVLNILTGNGKRPVHKGVSIMRNLSSQVKSPVQGTYRYAGTWETLDQIIVSEQLIDSGKGLYCDPAGFHIFNPGFLLENDPGVPGQNTIPTFKGFKYRGGFSDHLPVFIDLFLR